MLRLSLALLLTVPAAQGGPAAAQADVPPARPTDADTSTAVLRIEQAALDLARQELRGLSALHRLRPSLRVFASLSTRGRVFPAISSQGYDPVYSQIASWPGDSWGVSASWSLDQLLDRAPVQRARAAVRRAEARVELVRARSAQAEVRRLEQLAARRDADRRRADQEARTARRARLAAAELRIESGFLAQRLDAQRELLALAEMRYRQGELGYEALARQRLAVLSAEHAHATNAARLATAEAGELPVWVAGADAPLDAAR